MKNVLQVLYISNQPPVMAVFLFVYMYGIAGGGFFFIDRALG